MSLDRKHAHAAVARLTGLIAALAAFAPSPAAALEFCVVCSKPDTVYRCAFDDTGIARQSGLQLHCISTLAREGAHESCTIERNKAGPCAGNLKVLALPAGAKPEAVPTLGEAPAAETAPAAAAAQPEPAPADAAAATATDVRAPAPATSPEMAPPQAQPGSQAKWGDKSGSPGTNPAGEGQAGEHAGSGPQVAGEAAPARSETEAAKPIENAAQAVGDAAKTTGEALKSAGSAVGAAAKKGWNCLTSLFDDC